MSKVFVTSDLHFAHDREFIWGARGYKSVDEMNKEQLRKFNETVSDEDEVWILGDLVLGDIDAGLEYLKQLKGKIHVCLGNHDTARREQAYRDMGWDVHLAARFKYKKISFYLSHYPTITTNGTIESPTQVAWNIHGHTHATSQWSEHPYCYNVNVDAHNGYPVSLESLYEEIFNHFGQK